MKTAVFDEDRPGVDARNRAPGDEEAWRSWYDESFDALYAYALWRCAGLRDHADEVVQETWLVAVRRVGP